MRFLKILFLILISISVLSCSKDNASQQQTDKSADKPVNLTYSVFFPPTHLQAVAAADFAKEIEKRTNGRVKITVFAGGSLTKAPAVYEGVEQGVSDMGLSCFAYTRGKFPVTAALDLPLGYPNGITATKVADEFVRTFNPKELEGVKVLYVHAHGPGLLHTVKPVRNLKDLKGLKIRATGLSGEIVKALGAVPVGLAQGETYEALQRGTAEGTFGPIEVLKGWKQAEVVKSTTDCYNVGYTTAMFVVMNKTKWESLPEDIKKIFEETSSEWVLKHGEIWDKIDAEGREYTVSWKNQIISLDDKEKEEWNKRVAPVIQDYIKNTPDGEKYISSLRELLTKHLK